MIAVGTASNFSGDRGRALVSRMLRFGDFGQELGSNLIFFTSEGIIENGFDWRGLRDIMATQFFCRLIIN